MLCSRCVSALLLPVILCPVFLFSFLAVRSLVLPPPQGFHHHPLVHDSHIWVSSAGGSPEFSSCYAPHPALSYLTHLRWTHFSPHDAHTCFSSKLPHRSNGTAIHPVTQARILGIFPDSPISHCILLTLPSICTSSQLSISLHLTASLLVITYLYSCSSPKNCSAPFSLLRKPFPHIAPAVTNLIMLLSFLKTFVTPLLFWILIAA